MSIFNINNLFSINKIIEDNDISVNFNGNINDATVRDPSLKFNRPRYIRQVQYRAVNNIQFMDAEYDLATIAAALQTDGILNRAVNVFTEQIMKNGYKLNIPNDKLFNHVNNRLKEIELLTNIKNSELINTIARQLVTYGNAYVIKVRKKGVSKYGKPYTMFDFKYQPICGIFIVDASSMKIGLDIDNQIKWYKQVINGQEKLYDVDNVIHIFYNRVPGLLTGRSALVPVLDDVRALRKLEEEAEILGFQYAVPLYLYKVGTDTHPATPGEIDAVAMEINYMNTYGIMCVPHTHTVETVTSNNDPIDIMKYIEHFKKRIFTGLGVSPIAMGETGTANRNTAEAGYLSMQAVTKSYQNIISEKLEIELLKEIIMDGGYDPLRFEYNLRFNEIDLEATIKKETHTLQKYQANLITTEEARIEMQMETDFDIKNIYMNQIQIPLIKAEADAKAKSQIKIQENAAELAPPDQANHPETTTVVAKTGATATSGAKHVTTVTKKGPHALPGNMNAKAKNALTKSERTVTGNSKPTNQHGQQLGRPIFKKDALEELITFIDKTANNLFSNKEYSSRLNRDTFLTKINKTLENTILLLVDYDTEFTKEILNILNIRIKDRVDRLETIDSQESYEYIMTSIIDEIKSLDLYMENDNEE